MIVLMGNKIKNRNSYDYNLENYKRQEFVPTTEVAIQIATAILKPIFKNKFKEELPLSAKKQGNVWFIKGRERAKCSEADKKCFQFDQDPVRVEIDSVDGKILKVVKYK